MGQTPPNKEKGIGRKERERKADSDFGNDHPMTDNVSVSTATIYIYTTGHETYHSDIQH
jgi:hypothetical protein